MKKNILFILSLSMLLSISFTSLASAVNYPSGQTICSNNQNPGQCYYIYRPPGGSASKKYIGQSSLLGYLYPSGTPPAIASAPTSNFSSYSNYNWNLGAPCGSVVGDLRNGKIYIIQPIASDGDPGSSAYSHSNTFPLYVQSINTSSLAAVVKPNNIRWLAAVDNVLGNTVEAHYLPSCSIVKQVNSNSYYRLTGYVATDGMKNYKKSYIGTGEILNLWIERTGYIVTPDVDVSGYPNAANATMPPGMLVKSASQPYIYFSDDNGKKTHIQSMSDFTALGFNAQNIRTVTQTTIDSTPYGASIVWTP